MKCITTIFNFFYWYENASPIGISAYSNNGRTTFASVKIDKNEERKKKNFIFLA